MGATEGIEKYQQHAQLFAVVAGVCLHLGYFYHGEHHMYGLRYLQASTFFFITSTSALTSGYELPLASSLSFTTSFFGCLFLGLYGSLLCYRLVWHRERRFPGPTAAIISSLWYSTQVTNVDAHKKTLELYNKYGPFVRVGSSDLMISHPLGVPAIHGARASAGRRPGMTRAGLGSQSIQVEIINFTVNGEGCEVSRSATRPCAATKAALLCTTRHSSTP